ncbi:RloB family protein [Helicobacter cetorum]|uniref:RloB n=1 Tax=Helicobacter cetorum (strain ATCC BAA-429 / MIT 00-7128) TaxID=182217 RepID=I0EKQ6_HELC0|nr:RloB family protein [Helicobacter cetorum]AFI03525.1 RloB [Helicobacter cetorum MIT 00-7128]
MGSDELFKKRRARKQESRKNPSQEQKSRVLIVCEGEKTEPNYFLALKDYLRPKDIVRVIPAKHSSPSQILNTAKNRGENFDKVFCVMDVDKHETLEKALQETKENRMKPIISKPCFEFWILLHFEYCHNKPFYGSEWLVSEVKKKYCRDYSKGDYSKDKFRKLIEERSGNKARLTIAVEHAEKIEKKFKKEFKLLEIDLEKDLKNFNSYTNMHVLIKELNLFKQKTEN